MNGWISRKKKLRASVAAAFPGFDTQIVSTSQNEQVRVVYVSSDREPGVYYVLDRQASSITEFKRRYVLDTRQLSPVKPIEFTARDGLLLHGYLTVPLGSDGKKMPLVIHPHGGPFGLRDTWGYNPEIQFLASRGYAVLQINYRGSGGYGRDFIDKGRYQWGRAMQDDLTDAVKWAIAQGIADPARVAIYGASYGGYAALAGLTLTPELYRCGINYVGAADLEITFRDRGADAFTRGGEFDFQKEWVGPDSAYRAATSPLYLVKAINAPSLHAYGEKDPRVKIDHWTRLEPELKKYGKSYESIVESRQGHGFRDARASIRFYEAMEKFLAKHLAPDSSDTPSKEIKNGP